MYGIKLITLSFLLIYVSYLNSYEIITQKDKLQELENIIITKPERFIFIDYEAYFSAEEKKLIESIDKKKLKEKLYYFVSLSKSLKNLAKKDYKIFFILNKNKNDNNMQEYLHNIGICLHSYHFPFGITCESSNSYLFLEPYSNAKTLFNDNRIGFSDFIIYTNGHNKEDVISNFLHSCSLNCETIKSIKNETAAPTLRKRNSSLNISGNNF